MSEFFTSTWWGAWLMGCGVGIMIGSFLQKRLK